MTLFPPAVTIQHWSSAIGLFIINFGALDYLLLSLLQSHLASAEFALIRNRHFKDRIARLRALVQADSFSSEQKQAFEEFFRSLEPVRELRNHIAHGYILCRVSDDGKTHALTISMPADLDSPGNGAPIQLSHEAVQTALSQLTGLIESLRHLAPRE